ncbi:MAG: divergent polysaccharide deacetylase family protein [Elusimicrobia bacterium]|nr:divergent polysaccharide deacetylase family protein [Elusimicrobiota bacterium]
MLKWLVILAICVGAWWYWKVWAPSRGMEVLATHLERQINQELWRLGVRDEHILRQYRQERRKLGVQWIELYREIQLPPSLTPAAVGRALEVLLRHTRAELLRSEASASGWRLEIGRPGYRWFSLLLLPAPGQRVAGKRVAIVIDDLGPASGPEQAFLALQIPLTFAILPRERYSRALATSLHQAGQEVILHLPLEPLAMRTHNPGQTALLIHMPTARMAQMFQQNVASVPFIVGVNNHMGSAFTEDAGSMKTLLAMMKKQGLFFLDSRTSQHSVGRQVAASLGLPYLENEFFLDNRDDPTAIGQHLDHLLRAAQGNGHVIAIGHVQRKFLVPTLRQKLPAFQRAGVSFVHLSALLH